MTGYHTFDLSDSDEELFDLITIKKSDPKSVEIGYRKIKKLKMNFEFNRIESFYNWPIPFISINELSKNGFYYMGYGDRVKCNFCGVQLLDWKYGDVPSEEHKKWAPYCPLISNNNAKTANVPQHEFNAVINPIKPKDILCGHPCLCNKNQPTFHIADFGQQNNN